MTAEADPREVVTTERTSIDVPSTKQEICRSARKLFAGSGYRGTTTREIARDARVDPALIYHYYGTKEELFATAIGGGPDRAAILAEAEGPEGATPGERLLGAFLRVWDDPLAREPMVALVRSLLAYDEAVALISDAQVIGHFVRTYAGSQHELRTTLIGSTVIGILVVRYVFRVEPIASLPPETIAAILGPVLDHCLADDLPPTP